MRKGKKTAKRTRNTGEILEDVEIKLLQTFKNKIKCHFNNYRVRN